MASSYSSPSVTASQVGSYFVQQYYQMLQHQPDFVHQFYTDDSTMLRIDSDSTDSASAILQIHTLIQSLNFSGIEIKTINSLESLSGGVLVVVSGSVRSKYFTGWRKFVQTFFLAPQEKGYYVLNDVFHFVTEDPVHHLPVPIVPENEVDYVHHQPATIEPEHQVDNQQTFSCPPESAVTEEALELETREHLNSIHIEGDDRDDDYSSREDYQQEDPVNESVEEEKIVEEPLSLYQNTTDYAHQSAVDYVHQNGDYVKEPPAVEEPIGEPVKLTYASILRAKGKSMPPVTPQSSFSKPSPNLGHQIPEPVAQRPVSPLPYSAEVVEEGSSRDEEGESRSVYVRNLPTTVSTIDIAQEFKNFGQIKNDGVILKNRKDVGVCFAFVEFEDVDGVQKAIEASPIQIGGRQVYIEQRRANSSGISRGGRRGGRGRGSYPNGGTRGRYGTGGIGRGGNRDGGDNYGIRGNGFRS